jgi:hypothetical protein
MAQLRKNVPQHRRIAGDGGNLQIIFDLLQHRQWIQHRSLKINSIDRADVRQCLSSEIVNGCRCQSPSLTDVGKRLGRPHREFSRGQIRFDHAVQSTLEGRQQQQTPGAITAQRTNRRGKCGGHGNSQRRFKLIK